MPLGAPKDHCAGLGAPLLSLAFGALTLWITRNARSAHRCAGGARGSTALLFWRAFPRFSFGGWVSFGHDYAGANRPP
jgi:hypothetical protein